MMQGAEGSFASPAAQRGAQGRMRTCIMLLKRPCDVEMSRWPLLPAESGVSVKLHQESLSTYDARYRRKLCISGSSEGCSGTHAHLHHVASKGHVMLK